jgi:hypothetical protein
MTHSRTRFGIAALALLALVVPSSIAVSQAAIAASPNEVTFGMELYSWGDDFDVDEPFEASGITAHLYVRGGSGYTEVDTDVSDPHAIVSGTAAGDYRLRFSKGNAWIGVSDGYDLVGDDEYLETRDACSFDFDKRKLGDDLDLELYLSDLAGTTDCGAEGTAGVVSGTVAGIPAGEAAYASLYKLETETDEDFGDYTNFIWRGWADVNADGTYELPAVYSAGKYTVAIFPDDEHAASFFTTYYGDIYESYLNEETIADAAFTLAAGDSTAGRDITVVGATILHGVVKANGKPLRDSVVSAIDINDEDGFESFGVATESDGSFELPIPVGEEFIVGADAAGYISEYFDNVTDPMFAERITGTAVGDYATDLNFSLDEAPIAIIGLILKYDGKKTQPFSGVDVYLSRLTDDGWKAAGHQKVKKLSGATYVAFPKSLFDGETASLKPGTYRLKFKKNDRFVPLRASTVLGGTPYIRSGEKSCSIKLGKLDRGSVVVYAGLDPSITKPNCNSAAAARVAPGSGVTTPAPTGTPKSTPRPTATPSPTPTPTATPTPSATPTTDPVEPTATPSADPTADGASEPVNSTTLLIGGGILALLILGAAAFFIFRRRA